MIGQILIWYFIVLVLGVIGAPISFRLFHKLKDRGMIFSRIVVLFLWAYIHWLLVSLHLVKNNLAGVVFSLFLILMLSLYMLRDGQFEKINETFQNLWKTYVTAELIFLLFFVFMALMRATYPDISGTEKPMELAFINGILQSEYFPPQDPWLSGYGISYYYFGYVIIALLTQISGLSSGITYNLTAALWYGLIALAAYGLVFNLLSFAQKDDSQSNKAQFGGILAPFFILVVSNIEGFLEVLHAGGLFWQRQVDGALTSRFWTWLNILELNEPPPEPLNFIPKRYGGSFFWRASRVISDVNLAGGREEVIDEFPFFSFFLGDIHPHVLAVPFVIMIIALAFHFYLQLKDESSLNLYQWWKKPEIWFVTVFLGGLSFLNTWNFPIYVGLFSAVFAFHVYLREGWSKDVLFQFLKNGILLGLAGIVLYLPFYLSFSSQAGGILPSLSFFTRGVIFWVMFVPFLVPVFGWLVRSQKEKIKEHWLDGLKFSLSIIGGLALISLLLSIFILILPGLINFAPSTPAEPGFWERLNFAASELIVKHGETSATRLILQSIAVRLSAPGTILTLLLLLILIWVKFKNVKISQNRPPDHSALHPDQFVGLLVLLGAGLTLFPEFMYLRDVFATRMNTIFKFYYEAWILWGVAAAYATVVIFTDNKKKSLLIKICIVLTLVMALIYPVYFTNQRFGGFKYTEYWSLDGNRFRDEAVYEAGLWLADAEDGVLVEAVGRSYWTNTSQLATISGQQNVLGWGGHESQWRGGTKEIGSRDPDIRQIYESDSWDETLNIVKKYNIRYIVIGPEENANYRVRENKFSQNLPVVFQNETVVIYDAISILQ